MKNHYDFLKVFCLLLVVIGHILILYGGRSFGLPENRLLKTLCDFIYIFHMPLFIFLSGAVFSIGIKKGKYKVFLSFLKNKFDRILIPFLMVGSIFLAPTLVFLDLTNGGGFLTLNVGLLDV